MSPFEPRSEESDHLSPLCCLGLPWLYIEQIPLITVALMENFSRLQNNYTIIMFQGITVLPVIKKWLYNEKKHRNLKGSA